MKRNTRGDNHFWRVEPRCLLQWARIFGPKRPCICWKEPSYFVNWDIDAKYVWWQSFLMSRAYICVKRAHIFGPKSPCICWKEPIYLVNWDIDAKYVWWHSCLMSKAYICVKRAHVFAENSRVFDWNLGWKEPLYIWCKQKWTRSTCDDVHSSKKTLTPNTCGDFHFWWIEPIYLLKRARVFAETRPWICCKEPIYLVQTDIDTKYTWRRSFSKSRAYMFAEKSPCICWEKVVYLLKRACIFGANRYWQEVYVMTFFFEEQIFNSALVTRNLFIFCFE